MGRIGVSGPGWFPPDSIYASTARRASPNRRFAQANHPARFPCGDECHAVLRVVLPVQEPLQILGHVGAAGLDRSEELDGLGMRLASSADTQARTAGRIGSCDASTASDAATLGAASSLSSAMISSAARRNDSAWRGG
jgi:hypothetical protein